MRSGLIAFLLICLPSAALPGGSYGVGFSQLQADWHGSEMRVSIWYPSSVKGNGFEIGPFAMAGTRDAEIAPGRHGVVLLSHGTGGSDLGHRNVAAALALEGFIVAAPLHPGDNFEDRSGFETGKAVLDRPEHLSATLRALITSDIWAAAIDPRRLGVFGFSLGGHAIIGLLGGSPELAQPAEHCRRFRDDPLCRVVRTFELAGDADRQTQVPRDNAPIVCAAYFADPVTAFYRDEELAGLKVQEVVIARPSEEDVLSGSANAQRLANALSDGDQVRSLSERLVEGAGHYAFLAPFPAALESVLPRELVTDPPGFDRHRFNTIFVNEVAAFFTNSMRNCQQG